MHGCRWSPAERDEYVAGFDLRAAIGQLTAADIGLPVPVYDPIEYYSRIRSQAYRRQYFRSITLPRHFDRG